MDRQYPVTSIEAVYQNFYVSGMSMGSLDHLPPELRSMVTNLVNGGKQERPSVDYIRLSQTSRVFHTFCNIKAYKNLIMSNTASARQLVNTVHDLTSDLESGTNSSSSTQAAKDSSPKGGTLQQTPSIRFLEPYCVKEFREQLRHLNAFGGLRQCVPKLDHMELRAEKDDQSEEVSTEYYDSTDVFLSLLYIADISQNVIVLIRVHFKGLTECELLYLTNCSTLELAALSV